jgi:hypothetical protein
MDNIITGERIQELCDHFITPIPEKKQLNNPYFFFSSSKFLNIWTATDFIDNKKNVFIYGEGLPFIGNRLRLLMNPFNLIIGNGDQNFISRFLYLFDIPNLIKIIAQNVCVQHPKLFPLPIGIANSMWPHGKPELLVKVPKDKNIYFYFSIDTNRKKRQYCYDVLKDKLEWGCQTSYKDYVYELGRHKYAICPDGNGMDTHRLCECFYLKTIPICISSVLTKWYSTLFPVVLLDDWKDFDISNLKTASQTWDAKEMYMDYYRNLLK